ncbi:hypothetical protein N7491_011277 [Penicillium cf. griseofulvum]|uniref:Uncharacterized protein n=1 Tax=Penicillium cf. griseofulvum TaxID=2972120 RepID=A0A9W9JNA1_9EURO|nr:hypothetical protein N7472_004721 [Penicillium cf. griseofulvum]KAJ5416375.1 hypothetical protein N7491_011277 [Penicillium cf. griseofulvum]KAJ5442289.1 hypothetical protein N7445_005296 [Penicillium cf. griseofulvum]
MGFSKGLASGDGYSLIKAASKAAAEHQEQKRKQKESLQPATQRLRHAAQQQFYLDNKRRMGYKDTKRNNPHTQPSYPLHGSPSNHDSNVKKSKEQTQSQSTYQPSTYCTSTRTMDDPPPYDSSPPAQPQSTHQPSMCTRPIENPPPYDQRDPYEVQGDSKA